MGSLLEGLEKLHRTKFAAFRIGNVTVEAKVVQDDTVMTENEDWQAGNFEGFQVIWDVVKQQKARLDAKEKDFAKKEAEFKAEYASFTQAKSLLQEEHDRFVTAAKRQTADAVTLKERIETLLHDQQESVFDLESLCGAEPEQQSTARIECEAELDSLRKQVKLLSPTGADGTLIRHEMDLAEDILVEVMNGENPKKLHVQINVVKNRLIQYQGKQVIRDTEKMASNINFTIQALENDRFFVKSKERIKEKVIRRLTTPGTSPIQSPRRSPVRSMGNISQIEKKDTSPAGKLVLDAIISPKNSSRTMQESFAFPQKEPRTTPHKDEATRRLVQDLQETCQKQRTKLHQIAERLEKYQQLEMRLVRDKANLAVKEKQLLLWKDLLGAKEVRLNKWEVEMAKEEDQLRLTLARSLNMREARELLALTALKMTEQSQKVAEVVRQVEVQKAELKLGQENLQQLRHLLQRERKVVEKVHARMERERKQLARSKQELMNFMPELYSRINLVT